MKVLSREFPSKRTSPRRSIEYSVGLPSGEKISLGFTTRYFPCFIRSGSDFARVSNTVLKGPKERIACTVQVHSDRIIRVDRRNMPTSMDRCVSFRNADGLITRLKGVKLVIFSADCLPIFLIAPSAPGYVGIIHAGWKGTARRIAARGVKLLEAHSKKDASEFFVFMGPALRACCYEVGPEFQKRFPLTTRRGRQRAMMRFDLVEENKRQLISHGVMPSHIKDTRFCTSCQNRWFYSYRREGQAAGRFISWIAKDVPNVL